MSCGEVSVGPGLKEAKGLSFQGGPVRFTVQWFTVKLGTQVWTRKTLLIGMGGKEWRMGTSGG